MHSKNGFKNTFKRTALTALALLMLCPGPKASAATALYTVSAKKVNLRESPDTDAAILTVVRRGSEMTLLDTEDDWLKVSVGSQVGYVSAEYAYLSGIVSGGGTLTAAVTAAKLYVRSEPSSDGDSLGLALRGEEMTVLGQSGDWLQVTWNGVSGYVASDYVRLTTSNASSPASVAAAPTPVPDLSAVGTLTVGSEGSDITTLQKRLIELGYLSGSADGIFGSSTSAALKAFQTNKGLPVTGAADAATLAALGLASAPVVSDIPAPSVSSEPAQLLKKGSRGNDVLALQKSLIALGYLDDEADGIFGTSTESALKKFQSDRNLDRDGQAGPATLAALNEAVSASALQDILLKKGARGDDVTRLQQDLIRLGYLTGTADGLFGSATKAAVKAFQAANGLSADGQAGEKTLNAVAAAVAAVDAAATLREGSRGDAVKAMQQKLIALGYLSGSADGLFGSSTEKAVASFQAAGGITADGIAGASTLTALDLAYRSGSYTGGTITAPANIASDASIAASVNVSAYPVLKYGDTGAAVEMLQNRLKTLGYFNGTVGGNFGTLTRTAVIAFQNAANLTADGIMGSDTWTALYAADAPAAKNTVLREGDENADVQTMQTRLIALGYLSGTADGEFGSKTKTALQLFQRAAGMSVDGIAGPQTLAALYADGAPVYTAQAEAETDVTAPVNPSSSSYIRDTNLDIANQIIALAKKQLGCKYVYAHQAPPYFDCSGLTLYCYKQFGYSLKRTACDQGYDDTWPKITSIDDLQPGDLVYFNTNLTDSDLCDHAAIYIGDYSFIHASSSSAKVVISSLTTGYYKERFSWGRRVLNQ